MKTLRLGSPLIFASAGLLTLALPPSAVSAADQGPLRILLITGGCCHDYAHQKDLLKQGLEARAHVVVDQIHTSDGSTKARFEIYEKADWAKGYDVVIHDECSADVKDMPYVQNILGAHRDGVAAVNLHCAMHCYRTGTEDWFQFIGVQSTGHGPQEPIAIHFVDNQHPTTRGLADWATIPEELYNNVKLFPTAHPLARGKQMVKQRDGTEKAVDYVVAWANEYGKARVFSTTIGHNNATVSDPRYLDLVTRGLLWACGKLGDDAKPLPGYEAAPGKASAASAAAAALANWSLTQKFPAGEKPAPLFDGKSLNGWEGQIEKYWSVHDGAIIAKNSKDEAPKASTYLTTRKQYRNFRLVFEGKLVTSEMHSGISIWGRNVEKEGDPHSYLGHLVMFPSGWGFWDLYRRNSIYKDDGRAKAAGRQHDWNQMEILALGDRIRFAVNGKLVADWRDPKPELCQPGPIGLQLHSNNTDQEIQFRGLVLSENPEDRMITVSE